MNVWWSQTMVQGVGWTLLHFLWQGLVIAALLAIGLRLLRRGPAQYRYLAGCAALLLMTLAPLVTFQLVLKQDEPAPAPVVETMVPDASAPVERAVPRAVTLPKIVVTATRETPPDKVSWRLEPFLPWLVAAWLLGVAGLSCRLFAGWLQIRRLRRADAEALADGWPDKLAELARKLGVNRPLRLLRTACVEVPTVIGWLRPVILLPAACLTGLTPAQLESIIAHELAHIRRHDYLINLLQSAVETLLFYHPAVWWVSRRVREERENCCDDLVVEVCGDRVGYARALATLEELRPASAQLALAAGGAPLLQRIRRVLGQGERSAGRPAWPLAGVLAVVLLAVTAAGLREHRAVAANDGQAVVPVGKRTTNSQVMLPVSSTTPAQLSIGPVLDALPYVSADEFSVQMTLMPGVMNFIGYDNPGQFVPQAAVSGGSTITAVLPLPHFRLNQVITSVTPVSFARPDNLTNAGADLVYRDPWGNPYIITLDTNADHRVRDGFYRAVQTTSQSNEIVPTNELRKLEEKWDEQNRARQRTNLTAASDAQAGQPKVVASNGTLYARNDTTSQAGMFNWRVDGANQLNQQWFWFRTNNSSGVGARRGQDTSNGTLYARIYTTNQAGTAIWLVDSSNGVDQASSGGGSNQASVETLVQNGGFLVWQDNINEGQGYGISNVRLDDTNRLDQAQSTNQGNKIGSDNAILQVDEELKTEQRSRLNTSKPNLFNRTNLVYTGQGRQVIFDKLNRIRIDKVNYANLPLKEVADDLMRISRNRDPEGNGINFFFDREAPRGTNAASAINPATGLPVGGADESDISQVRVNISLNNVRLADVLDAITKTADRPVKYSVLDYAVVFSLRGDGPLLEIRTFRVDPNTFIQGLESVTGMKLGGGSTGTSGGIGGGGGPIVAGVNVTPSGGGIGGGTGGSAGGVGGLGGGAANGGSGSGTAFVTAVTTSAVTSNIQAAVRLYFAASGIDLSTNAGKTVIYNERRGTLTIRATSQDLGVIEDAVLKLNTSPSEGQSKTNSAEIKQDSQNAVGFQWNVDGFKIGNAVMGSVSNQSSAPQSATAKGVLKDPQLHASVQALIQRSGGENQSVALETRTFRVDPKIFLTGLQDDNGKPLAGGGGGTATNSAEIQRAVRRYFGNAGVDLSTNAGKVVIFNERKSTLTVRATPQDLDLIEASVQTLNQAPPEVNIKARFVEITRPQPRGNLLYWDVGLSNMMHSLTNEMATNAQYGYVIGPSAPGSNSVVTASSGMHVVNATLSGVLTDPQFREVLKALEQRDGVDILTSPEITTESGRPAQMRAVDIQTVVTATNVTASNFSLATKEVSLGPVLDVVPTVSGDEFTIQLTLMPSILEFLGYDDPGQFALHQKLTNGTTVTATLPLPHFRIRQAVTTVTVWDGQTVVIGGFAPVDFAVKTKDKVPLLGDLPLLGQLFKSEHSQMEKKYLLIFVTPTIINPDGTRYHKDEEMPFAKVSVPPQAGTNAPPKK